MRIKITDFGTAKLLNKEELIDGRPQEGTLLSSLPSPLLNESILTTIMYRLDPSGRARTRSFVGTPEYVSPEVLSEGRESSFS
jgi:serine/threonine protein kinase